MPAWPIRQEKASAELGPPVRHREERPHVLTRGCGPQHPGIEESRERQDQAEARRATYGTSGYNGRRRRHDPGPPSEVSVSDDPAVPG